MATLNEVYRKFGEVAEAAQLLETELGNVVLMVGLVEADLLAKQDTELASAIFQKVNRQTLGQLLKTASASVRSVADLEALLVRALGSATAFLIPSTDSTISAETRRTAERSCLLIWTQFITRC